MRYDLVQKFGSLAKKYNTGKRNLYRYKVINGLIKSYEERTDLK